MAGRAGVTLRRIPCAYMRGGTSRALVFHARDLPAERPENRAEWDAIFLAAMGVPDANGRNLDGMGGGLSSLNKVCVVGPPSHPEADVDYTFAQCAVQEARVDYGGNCGNMSAAIGPFAVEEGLVPCPSDGEALVRIHNTNTGKIIHARFPVERFSGGQGALASTGDLEIDGVSGPAAPIRLEFLSPGGAKTGKLLPTGMAAESFGTITISCVDAANPCVFVAAEALGKTGHETPQALEADAAFLARMEDIRQEGARRMGIAGSASVPLVAMVAAPHPPRHGEGDRPQSGGGARADAPTPSGQAACAPPPPPAAAVPLPVPGRSDCPDLIVRMISMGQPHRATPITGAICLALAARVPGSVPQRLCASSQGPIRLGHPSGVTVVDAALDGAGQAIHGAVYRTARRLFEGQVLFHDVNC